MTARRYRSPLSPLGVAMAAIVLAASAVTWSAYDHATHQHADALEIAGSDLRHHAQAAAQTLDMLAQGIAMATTDVAERLGDQAFPEATNPARVHDLLRRKLADLPQVSRLSVVDATGAVVSDSLRHPPMEPPVGPPPLVTDLFKGHPDRWVGLLPAGADPARLVVGRPVRGEDGAFRGVVVAEVDGALLRDSLWTTSGAQIDGLAVIDQTGTVVTAQFGDPSARPPAPGTPLTADRRFQGLPALLGQGSGTSTVTGDDRLHAIHQTSTLPLRVVVTQRLDVPLDAWRAGTLVPALILAGGSWAAAALLIAVLAALARQNRRVRRELRDSEARLDQLVEASPAVIYGARLDDGFNATYFSRNLAQVLGHDAAEALRTPDWWVSHIHPDDRDRVLRDASLWLESGAAGTYGHRYRFRAADGTWRWVEDQLVAVRDGDGRVRDLIGSLIDISEAMEGAERLRKLAGNVPGMIFQFRRRSGTVSTFPYCSDGIRDILGLSPADVAVDGDLVLSLVHPDDRPAVERAMSESRHSLTDWNGEFRVLHPQRGEIWVAGHAKPEPQSDGAVLWHGYLSEVTLRKKAQQALEASEERLGLILRGANDAPWDWDLVADTMYYAPRWWDMLGLEVGSLPGGPRLWQELLHPDDAARMAPVIQETFADPSKDSFEVEFRLRHRDGHYVPVLSRGIILRDATGTPYRLAGANTDLTERRALEHALADSERLYRSIFENVSDAIFLVGVEGGPGPAATFRFLRSNPADQRATGLNDIGGLPPHAFLPADIADQVTRRYADCVALGAPVVYEETVALPAGQRVWSTTLNPVRDDSGAITLLVGISRDITDTKRSERLIRESEERLATYFRLAPLGIYIADAAGRYQEVNAAACAQSGFTADEFKAMSIPDYVVPEAVGEGLAHFERVLEAGISHGEVRLRRKDGSWFWGMVVAGALPDGRVIAFVEDVTDRRRTEESLHRSNADLEQFAYVASHDLRQPLRMVNSYLQLVARRLGPALDSETAEFITYARDGAKRMDEMLVALLEFSRVGRTGLPMMPVHSGEALDEALRFLGPTIDETGTQVRREGSWPTVLASRDELVRLFQNLIDNAMKYRPADATPTITLTVDRADDGWRFQITDNGIGIPADQIPRLFKVFQRLHTREEFDGTGIGLAVCRKIVERHGGHIWVDSAGPGTGSTFGFTLPATVAVTDLVEG
ncbi:PAS domain-containing protein [Novispirillum sp. DQ9]|uniref:PAS domain-containing protein n=1 Tax=Novispirillum sp. DQ9 TaxID=3398612 RepID=UPI003C7B9095